MIRWTLPVLAALLVVPVHASLAQRPAGGQSFDSFKMVRTRNIFDPDRRPPPSQNGGGAAVAQMVQSDYIALTGTLVSEDKALAFFSGSRSDFDQVLPVKEKIAGATITKISPGSVTIERAGKAVTVAVGWTVPLNGGASAPAPAAAADVRAALAIPTGTVPVAGAIANPVPLTSPVASAAATVPSAAPAAATPNPDVARMMRERRLQETQ